MFPRDWILETLAGLAVWYWPILFWEMFRIERYCAAQWAGGDKSMFGIGVTRKGRIHIICRMAGDTPRPDDWSDHAPRSAPMQATASHPSGLRPLSHASSRARLAAPPNSSFFASSP